LIDRRAEVDHNERVPPVAVRAQDPRTIATKRPAARQVSGGDRAIA